MNRIRQHLTYANVMATIAVFVVLGGTTYAATGGNFILGQSNTAGQQSSLSASPAFAGKTLQLTNTSTGAGATALGLNVASGHPPFTVNSGTKVANLNADKLDGVDSTGFLPSGNVKSLRFITGGCVNATDPGCSTTFSLGGLSLGANCYATNGGTVAHLELDNTSGSSEVGIEYVSGSTASQSVALAAAPLVDLTTTGTTPPVKEAQGSVINLDTLKPETANVAMRSALAGDNTASCGLWLLGVKSR
jgi:hypothetical protein